MRKIFTYADWRLEEWRTDTLDQCAEILRWVDSGYFRQNEKHCQYHYGQQCSYYDVCMVPAEQRAIALSTDLYQDYGKAAELEGVRAT